MEIKFTMAVLKAIKNQIYSVFNPNAHFEKNYQYVFTTS